MSEESELNALVWNVLHEKRFSHCRLCLQLISDEYVRFKDFVAGDAPNGPFQMVSELLAKLLGEEISEEIPGIDAVCLNCIDEAFIVSKFKLKCENSTRLLNNVLDNLAHTLNVDVDVTSCSPSLYISVDEHESKLIVVNEELTKKTSKTSAKKNFHCSYCSEAFDDEVELKVHNITHHENLICLKCNETVQDEAELSTHDNSDQMFQCSDCDTTRCTEDSLKKHQNRAHTQFVCKKCGKSFRKLERLQAHEQKHFTKSECPKCGKRYNTKHFFLKHVKLCLEDRLDPHPLRSKIEKPYYCEPCGKGYSTPGGLRVHNRFVHGDAKPHVCEFCNKQFTAPSYLKIHMIKHTGEKNFKCDLCSKKFVSKEALLYHTRRHTGEKPYSCTMCDERFVNGSARAEHIKFKHVGPTLMCEICSRKFVTPNFLKVHMKKHFDPSNKLYVGRSLIPPNVPGVENMRVRYIIP